MRPAPFARAQAPGQIVVYNKGKVLHFDPDVGAELKEVILETYDCASGQLVKKETIEAYFHLSDDKEIITPDAITEDCHKVFKIDKRGDKYYFLGVREGGTASEAEVKAAVEAAPPPTRAESVRSVEEKVRKVAREIVKIDPSKAGSSTIRERIINQEFTTSLSTFDRAQLEEVARYVRSEPDLSPSQQYYVLRSFGFVFFRKGDYDKAIFFYEKCAELIPENYSAHFQRAVAHEKKGEADEAIRAYARATRLVAGRGGRTADSVLRYFKNFLASLRVTPTLSSAQLDDLRGRVDQIAAVLARKDLQGAQQRADELGALVDGWYGGAASGPAPSSPPGQPGDGPPPEDGGF
ncbi:MAG: hypothetical protein KatS3mg102_2505 [Planctomycetota bacterium]|nr:MAG: hypothetical protein KatS3mg102_2505 [Planctomycetota bacterium]